MVSSAIACLDQQEKDLLDGSHPQLLWLWQELERRKEAQYFGLKRESKRMKINC